MTAVEPISPPPLTPWEDQTIDTRFSVRGAQRAPRDILVVAVDQQTFDKLRLVWPAPRRYHAKVINILHRDGARAIGVDIQFTVQTDQTDDNALITAVRGAPGTVLATTTVFKNGQTNVFGGGDLLRQIHARAGEANVRGDTSGVIYQVPLAIRGLGGFAWALAEASKPGLRPPPQQPTWIDYAGPPGTLHTVSYWKVYDGLVPASEIRGRTVVVGVTDPTQQDLHSTPTSGGGFMSGPELQANAVETFLRGGPLRATPLGVDLLLIVLIGGFAPLMTQLLRNHRWLARIAPVLAGALYVGASQLAFNSAGSSRS